MSAKKNPKKKSSKKNKKQHRPHGHFCYACGEHKAHEKFSGRGHANHICKACKAMPVAERNEMMAVRKIENMAFRYLNEQEIKWLRNKMNDPRQDVRDAAREAHKIKFPRYERNIIKKGLTARSLEFFVNGEVWNDYGDIIHVHMRFFADNSGVVRRIDYDSPEGERETVVNIERQQAAKFLKAVVHQLNAPFWTEDTSEGGLDCFDPYLDDDFDEADEENETPDTRDDRELVWSLHLDLNKGGEKMQTFYDDMHDESVELFWWLMEWFEKDDGFDDELADEEGCVAGVDD